MRELGKIYRVCVRELGSKYSVCECIYFVHVEVYTLINPYISRIRSGLCRFRECEGNRH